MEPQWHQDINTKGIQPKHMPHFEVAGSQIDWEYRKKAAQLFVSVLGLISVVAIVITLISYLPQAIKAQKTTFGQMPRTSAQVVEKHHNKIQLRIQNLSRESEVPGQLFLQNKARDGFIFVIVELTVYNKSEVDFTLNPFDFRLFLKDGSNYRAALATKSHPKGINTEKLSPKKTIKGVLIFQVPKSGQPDKLELVGLREAIASVQL